MLKSFIIKKLLKSVTENVLFYKYYLHIPRSPPWLGVVSFFFLYSWYRYPFPVLCITRVYISNNVKQNKHYFIVTFILSIGIFFFVCVCVCDTKKGLFFCPDYRCRGGAIAAAAMCDCGQNAAYALITATSVSSHPVNENSSDEPIINQLVHRPNGFRLYYSLDLFFIPRPVPHKYRVCVCVFIFYVVLTVRRVYWLCVPGTY